MLFNAPNAIGPSFSAVVSVLNPPAGASGPVDLAKERSALIDAIVESDEAPIGLVMLVGAAAPGGGGALGAAGIAGGELLPQPADARHATSSAPARYEAAVSRMAK